MTRHAARRSALLALAAAVVASAFASDAPVTVIRDVEYPTPHGAKAMDIYLLQGDVAAEVRWRPCLIWMHGAGDGDKADGRSREKREFLARNGIVAASINFGPNASPTLIFEGIEDANVPIEQARTLAALLAKHDVPHELVSLGGFGHALGLVQWKNEALPADLRPILLQFLQNHFPCLPRREPRPITRIDPLSAKRLGSAGHRPCQAQRLAVPVEP